MADIQFYQDDSEDGQDDEADELGLGPDDYEESLNPDEGLTPLQKIEKYMCSENIYSRQMVARSLLDTLRIVRDTKDEANMVLQYMVKISEDSEPSVRTELMEQVPHIAMFCQECPEMFDHPMSTYILPVIVKSLMDNNNLVRKTSQAALLVLMEQSFIDNVSIEEYVCPVINELSSPDSMDDFRTEAVALMSKLAPLVGRDITERFFMPRFSEMCTDALFYVRKVCAGNFGDMCNVVGQENTENVLLTKFCYLCEDGVWGVRKACAECFMQVSYACSAEVRKNDLTQLFVGLVCDQSRWVRMAAFHSLGSFISTFADPSVTGLYVDDDGLLNVGNPEDFRKCMEAAIEKGPDSITMGKTEDAAPLASEEASFTVEDMEIDDIETETKDENKEEAVVESNKEDNSSDSQNDHNSLSQESDTCESGTIENSTDSGETIEGDQTDSRESGTSVDSVESSGTSVDMEEGEDEATDIQDKDDQSPEEKRAIVYENENKLYNSSEQSSGDNNASNESTVQSSESERPTLDESSQEDTEPADNTSSEIDNIPVETDSSTTSPSNSDPWSDSNIGGAQSKKAQLTLHVDTSSKPDDGDSSVDPQSPDSYSSFLYWRDPLPEFDIEKDLSPNNPEQDNSDDVISSETQDSKTEGQVRSFLEDMHFEEKKNEDDSQKEEAAAGSNLHVASENTVASPVETVANIGSVHVLLSEQVTHGIASDASNLSYSKYQHDEGASSPNSSLHSLHESVLAQLSFFIQDVIPQELLEHYLSMTDQTRAQTVDTEIAKHCAYSFPAVAYTLGRKNWNCLRDLYDTLAGDMQWKVRRTLAFSIHELALILGEEITTRDLVPIFNGFLRDLDEVRVGVLKHFADFLRLLSYETRQDYLTKIPEFLNTDNNRNWRFREDLAEQLLLLLDLYTAEDVNSSIVPVVFSLCEDGVSAVRASSFRVVAGLLKKFTAHGEKQLPSAFVNDIVGKFAHNQKWCMRQFYAQICGSILEELALPEDRFATDMLPSLLALGKDPIPNVRITLAKTLCNSVLMSDHLTSAANPHHEELLTTVQALKQDSDRDVRYFIAYESHSDLSSPHMDTIPV